MKNWLVLLMIPLMHLSYASDSTDIYNAGVIRKELKENANTVVRYHRTEVEVQGPEKAIMRWREVVTILNPKGEHELVFSIYTDKFKSLEEADLLLYDANGKLIERHKKKDLSSTSAGSGLVEDGKMFFFRLSATQFPVTVERIVVYRFRGLYGLPNFYFTIPYQSVEYTSMILRHPAGLKINHKLYNIQKEARHSVSGSDEVWQWEASNLLPPSYESNAGDWRFNVPSISFSLSKFEYDGYPGDMSSWKSLGLWYNSLLGNTNRLSPRYQEEIRQLVAGASDDREKVRMLYSHLQKNFRYVSIQLGIGGFKPFPADFVHEKKYGDCKGLSNYMEACLHALGIKSHNAWIKSGANETGVDANFPHDGFDHQILMVPLGKDSIWLECTSDHNDFGHLGSFTENRYALVMTDQGGKLIRTPRSQASANVMNSYTTVKLNEEGNADVGTRIVTTGEFKYMMIGLSRVTADKQKSYLINYFGMTQPDDLHFSFKDQADSGYLVDAEVFSEKGYDFKAGSKYFFKPRVYRNWTTKLTENEKRQFDYFIDYPFIKTDTTVYILPNGFTVETLPKDKSLVFSNGSYMAKYWWEKESNRVYAVFKFSVNDQQVPAAKYQEAKKFFDQVMDDGNQKIILLRNTD